MKKYLWQIIGIPAQLIIARLFIVALFIATPAEAQQPGSWQRKKNFPDEMPSPRVYSFSFTIGDKGYMGTGYSISEDVDKSDFWEYDAANDTWSQKADFPTARAMGFSIGGKGYGLSGKDFWEYDPVADRWSPKSGPPDSVGGDGLSFRFSVGGKGYFGTGDGDFVETGDKVFVEYDPATDAWTKLGDFPGVGRWGGVGFSIGSKGYFGLGGTWSGTLNDFWEYDPASASWTQKNNFPATGDAGFVSSVGSKGYIGVDIRDFWEYDPTRDSWARISSLTGDYWGWGDAFAFAAGGRVYVGDGAGYKDNFLEFNPANNTWTAMQDLEDRRKSNVTGFSIGNKGYFGTGSLRRGHKQTFSRDFWEYDPSLDTWTQKADFGGTARDGAVGLGIGSKGYIGTGKDSSGERNDFWEYDPATNTWLQQPDYPGGLVSGANSFTIGTKGYIIEPSGRRLWEYEPVSGQWTRKATLTGGTSYGVVSFAVGNKGYYGGADYQGFFEYDPVTDTWTMKSSIIKTLDESRNLGASNIAGFSIGNNGYLSVVLYELFAGPHPGIWEHFYEYDPVKDEWVDLEPFSRFAGNVTMTIANKGYICFFPDYEMWEYTQPDANTITTHVTATEFCSLKTFSIPFIATGTFNAGNVFTAQLSNSSGSFDNAVDIGSVTSIAGGIITATIPRNIPAAKAYRIRVISSSPAITGGASEVNLSVNPPPVVNTKNLTVYLNRKGEVSVTPNQVNNGSTAYCGGLSLQLDKSRFDCTDIGANTITLTGKDCNGNIGNNTAIITVLDTIRPVIRELSAYPRYLWPPNNKLKKVSISYKAADNCRVKSIVLSVACNEPPQPGRPDWIIINNHQVLLRAARSGRDQERTYTISITATDGCGNSATGQVTVSVARRRKHHHHSSYHPAPGKAFREQDSDEALVTQAFTVRAQPNPAAQHFTIITKSDHNEPISFRIMDAAGRVIEERSKIAPNSTVQLGERYLPGIYYLQAIQQKKTVTLLLVKGAQ